MEPNMNVHLEMPDKKEKEIKRKNHALNDNRWFRQRDPGERK